MFTPGIGWPSSALITVPLTVVLCPKTVTLSRVMSVITVWRKSFWIVVLPIFINFLISWCCLIRIYPLDYYSNNKKPIPKLF
jgi:pilus assembly protein TadC